MVLKGYCSCPKLLLNACAILLLGYIKNPLGSITYILNPRGVLHSHTKTYKENNTFMKVFCKHHGLNHFGLGYCRSIACAHNYSMHMLLFILGYIINPLGSITYLLKLGGVLHSHTKTYKESNTLVGVICKHHGLNYFGLGYRRGIAHVHNYSIHMHYPF